MDHVPTGASLCPSQKHNSTAGGWSINGNKLLTLPGKPDVVHERFSQQISELKPWHLRKREQLMRLAFRTQYVDDLWNPLVNEAAFRLIAAQIYPD